ncbi:hypothetical protein ANO11243_071900 [Dothideomycetidae sp. 11243]|nr:hypothetical protein ANO11243_071900 [fungal sp. No.11243]
MHGRHFRQGLILVGLVLTIYLCVVPLISTAADSSSNASTNTRKPIIFEEDKNAKLFIHADERNDAEFFARISSKARKAAKGRNKGQGILKDSAKTSVHALTKSIPHEEIFSETSKSRRFIPIFTGGREIYNPNVIPHPTKSDVWMVFGQHQQSGTQGVGAQQLVCAASLLEDVLSCTEDPAILSMEPSIEGQCDGKYATYNMRQGARDARVFYGPDAPMIAYGSQSSYACLGMWLQDLRSMVDVYTHESSSPVVFRTATEMLRPPPSKRFEKNFFLFWDENNEPYVHHDMYPRRVFAALNEDGTIGPNMAVKVADKDNACTAKYLPRLKSSEESVHQATNSLLITMCRRSDYDCRPHEGNTFIMTILHYKTYRDYHSVYEPYVMLFQNQLPFAIHAIGRKPLWIHGRRQATEDMPSAKQASSTNGASSDDSDSPNGATPTNQTEMFYMTSMSWKTHGQRYHGYIDDPIFLAFGIEDTKGAVMDVNAEHLVQNLGYCGGTPKYS